MHTNAPGGYLQTRTARQNRKVFASWDALDKYLNGRIKVHTYSFAEISPSIPSKQRMGASYHRTFQTGGSRSSRP
ncbi:MAG: hypothetical protein ACLTJE_24545 [Enterocloster bolteae]|uniref:hypothetical protein n=1 Tax=Lachnospiraceae TaxID=186803 RepID=UPI00223EB427|nr:MULTISPECIES: hypothetical protein [Clostridia]MDU1140766.1 hypothetical protein [Enterocloster bolteae]